MTGPTPPKTNSLFFYGTLMAPSVLHRVISSSTTHSTLRTPALTFNGALLPSHRRRRVRSADYPAVTPDSAPASTSSVRGTLVCGLSEKDVAKLDLFEGDEYERRVVRVRLLPDAVEEGGGVPEPLAYGGVMPVAPTRGPANGSGAGAKNGDGDGVEGVEGDSEEWTTTQTYIWTAAETDLEDSEWDFEQFRREKLHLWAGDEVRDSGMEAADRFERDGEGEGDGAGAGSEQGRDGTRGRGVQGGQFERAVREKEEREKEKEEKERRINGW